MNETMKPNVMVMLAATAVVVFVAFFVCAADASPLDELLPRPKEVLTTADGSLSVTWQFLGGIRHGRFTVPKR